MCLPLKLRSDSVVVVFLAGFIGCNVFLSAVAMGIEFKEDVKITGELSLFYDPPSYPAVITGVVLKNDGTISSYGIPLVLNPKARNVGIGIESPQQRLHVVGNRIRLENADKILDLRADGSDLDVHALTNDLYIRSSGTDGKNRVLINPFGNDGNVAIGTTKPCYRNALHVVESPTGALDSWPIGVRGDSATGTGVYGTSNSSSGAGVWGDNKGTSGSSIACGVHGSCSGGTGVVGSGGDVGVSGSAVGKGFAIYGQNTAPSGFAGWFHGNVMVKNGDLKVTGKLVKSGGYFRIDHPLDPDNKYLNHAFVESPDMKNVYDGMATLDVNGEVCVELPTWFNALNRDFRYQLTPIGAPMPNLYVAEEISANRFKIAGGSPGMKVSWQVTGIRRDPWANKYRIPIEEKKPRAEQGLYLHPELYNQPESKNIIWTQNPKAMRHAIHLQRIRAKERKDQLSKVNKEKEEFE